MKLKNGWSPLGVSRSCLVVQIHDTCLIKVQAASFPLTPYKFQAQCNISYCPCHASSSKGRAFHWPFCEPNLFFFSLSACKMRVVRKGLSVSTNTADVQSTHTSKKAPVLKKPFRLFVPFQKPKTRNCCMCSLSGILEFA